MKVRVINDTAPTEPGKSTRKGANVLIQGASVSMLVAFALSYFRVENPELWLGILVPVLTAAWHTAQKFILHQFGIKIVLDVPGKDLLPVLLVGLMLLPASCATMKTVQVGPEGDKFSTVGFVLGKGSIADLRGEFNQTATDAEGTIETTIGQSSSGLISENDLLVEAVVSAAIRGAVEATIAAGIPSPQKAAPPPVKTVIIPQPPPGE